MEIQLDMMQEGQRGEISSVRFSGAMRRRLIDFGLIEGTRICCLRRLPFGGPALYLVRGTMLALRKRDSRYICVELCE